MKKLIFLIFIFISTYSFSQWSSEYDYFSLKIGANHTMFTPQPKALANKMLISQDGSDNYLLVPDSGFNLNYVPGYYGTFVYNHDLKNNNAGVSLGISYNMYGVAANYHSISLPIEFSLREVYYVSQISIPMYIKYGKKFYESQKYFYGGASFSYNLFFSKTEFVSEYSSSINRSQPADYKDMLKKTSITAIAGYNYMFFNFELNYVFGNFLNKKYTDDVLNIQPFEGQPQGTFILKTGVTIPLNSWTSRKVYAAEMWFRRLLR